MHEYVILPIYTVLVCEFIILFICNSHTNYVPLQHNRQTVVTCNFHITIIYIELYGFVLLIKLTITGLEI